MENQLFKKLKPISIHLMLWFNYLNQNISNSANPISIHLMLWFNSALATPVLIVTAISIHLMLWFNQSNGGDYLVLSTFQYILCCGSTFLIKKICLLKLNFNTSYVVVQRNYEKEIKNLVGISIHLMLWFNINCQKVHRCIIGISIHLMLWFNVLLNRTVLLNRNFNTSYVVVQLKQVRI